MSKPPGDATASDAPVPAAPALDAAGFDAAIGEASARFASAPAEAVTRARAALASLSQSGSARQWTMGRWALGMALSYAGQYAQGIAELERALAGVPPDDERLRCRVLRSLSIANEQLGALEAALDWALQALDLARRQTDARALADALLSAGVARSRCGDPEAGLRLYDEARALYEGWNEAEALLSVLNNLGINCKNLGRHQEAVDHLSRARQMAHEIGKPHMAGVVASNLGEPLWRLGRLDEAVTVLREAVTALAGTGFLISETHARVVLGEVLLAQGDEQAARDELECALRIALETGSANHVARAHLALSALHKAAGRHDTALTHHEAFHAAERRQYNEDSARKLNALHVQHDLAEARLQAETQRLRHSELRQAHDELQAMHQALLAADREKSRLVQQLESLSRSDALTGLANRRRLDEGLRQAFELARREHAALSVALCDLDDFKRINDRLGHATGDAVLREVAALLRRHCGSADLVARYGGEEFCIAFIGVDGAAAEHACEVLRGAVHRHDWTTVHPQLTVTLSIGVADDLTLPDHEALIAAADMQLYEAKRSGKNRVCRDRRPAGPGAAVASA